MNALIHFLRNSVRGRLSLLILAIALPAILLVVLLVWQGLRNERESVSRHFIATVRALSSRVDQQMGQSEALLRGLATSRELTRGDLAAFQGQARAALGSSDHWILLADGAGRPLLDTRIPSGAQLERDAPTADDQASLGQGRTYISNLERNAKTGRFEVRVVMPVLADGERRFVMSHGMPAADFIGLLQPERFAPASVATIMDRQSTIVARYPNGEQFVGGKPMPDILTALARSSEGIQESVTLEGEHVLAVFSRAPISGWSVAMGAPSTALHASGRRLLGIGLATAALLMTSAILVAVWIGRSLVRGIDTLVVGTEQIGRGTLPKTYSSGLDETDFVATAMLRTAVRLNERDQENATLTVALQAELAKQKIAEENSRRLAAIVESSDDAIIGKNLDGVITSWNRGAERIFGYSPSEIIGRSVTVLIPPGREEEEPAIITRIRAGERVEHFETFRRRKDGEIVAISLTISPLRGEDGTVVGASKIARDISPRHRMEAQQQSLYELVGRVNRAEALPEIYEAALDAMGRCCQADRAAILLGDPNGVMRFVASRHLPETYRRAVEGHSPWPAFTPNPQSIWFDDVAAATLPEPVRDAVNAEGIKALAFVPLTYERRLLGKFMVYFDAPHHFAPAELQVIESIASQVAFAIERQRGAEALEMLVNERTASLRQAVAQMEEFSYSVSHDLRAPVRAMRSYAEILLQDHGWRLDLEARELLSRVVRNGTRMDRMIQDLLTYSQTSRRELRLEPVSLDRLVREVVQQYPDMRPELADIEVEGPLPEVIAHEPSLTQVVSNLLSNAVKFVPPHARPRVRVGFDRRDGRARLWVADNGIGIKPEHQTRLFGMFERIHTERNYEGNGIGLAIVRKAIERMNGAVGVESDGVSGTTFWFELPLAKQS